MILSDHAKEEMQASGITEDEVKACLENGELEIKQIVNGETRYGCRMAFREKTIIVIYTYVGEEKRVITCYPIWRKKAW